MDSNIRLIALLFQRWLIILKATLFPDSLNICRSERMEESSAFCGVLKNKLEISDYFRIRKKCLHLISGIF
jgi:hypothetical protein